MRPQAFRQRSDRRALLARPSGLRARSSAAARRLLGHLRRDLRQPVLEAASLESMGTRTLHELSTRRVGDISHRPIPETPPANRRVPAPPGRTGAARPRPSPAGRLPCAHPWAPFRSAAYASLGPRAADRRRGRRVEPLAGQGMEGRFLVRSSPAAGQRRELPDRISTSRGRAWTRAAAGAGCSGCGGVRAHRHPASAETVIAVPVTVPGQRHDPPSARPRPATAPGSTSVRKRWALLGMTWKRCCGACRGSCARRGS